MKKNILPIAFIMLLFVGIGIYVGVKQNYPANVAQGVVQHFLALDMTDASGRTQPISQWKNKTLLVNFWASWCAPCVQEMPELSALQQEFEDKNIQILGIGIDSSSNIREFSAKHKIAYPLYVTGTEGTELSRQFGNHAGGLPFTVLISADGQLKKTYLGRLDIQALRADLKAL